MTHQSIIEQWEKRAEGAKDRAFRFFRWLKTLDPDRVDNIAKETHTEVFKAVSCTDCANCCRTLKPQFLPREIQAASKFLGLNQEEFTQKYLTKNAQNNWETNDLPCPFLADNGFCNIYEVRPGDCSGYPHTDKKHFAGRSWSHAENAATCPAVFTILERMKDRMGYADMPAR